MCIFIDPVERVSNTHIYGRLVDGHQLLAYEMKLSTPTETAMLLPIPVPADVKEDAVEFISLEDYPEFFEDLEVLFDAPVAAAAPGDWLGDCSLSMPLEVHRVGAYDASFVPRLEDFARLDPRFRLPDTVWDALPAVADYGFAVFKLAAGSEQQVHPMAFRFPTRHPDRVFFPTIHIHDGQVHGSAEFDHALFCQVGGLGANGSAEEEAPPVPTDWSTSDYLPEARMQMKHACALVNGKERCLRRDLHGAHPNMNVMLEVTPIRQWAEAHRDALPES